MEPITSESKFLRAVGRLPLVVGHSRLLLILTAASSALPLSFAAFPAVAQVFNAAEYFPLQSGNQWTYEEKSGSETTTVTETVLDGTVFVNGAFTKAVQDSDGAIQYYTNDSNGLRLHRQFVPDVDFPPGITATYSPPAQLAAAHMSIGDTISGNGTVAFVFPGLGSFPLDYASTSTMEIEESVSVPLGNFLAIRNKATLTLTGSILGQPLNVTEIDNTWLARHVGTVRETGELNGESTDPSELIDVRIDTDGDGVNVIDDNCPAVANLAQSDTDRDGEGNACDADDDNDTILDGADNCPVVANTDQADNDNDAAGDVCDADDDNDGVSDDDELATGRNPLVNEGAVSTIINSILLD